MKARHRLLYVQKLNKEWRLVLTSTFNTDGNNFLEIAIPKAYAATADSRIEKTIKALTNKFAC